MKKRVMITGIILAMAIAGTGCGAKSNSSEAAQAKTTVKEEKKEVTKSNKQDINTDEINNSNTDGENLIQDGNESDINTTQNEVSNDSAKSSKDASKTTDKKVVKANSESNTTSSRNTTTNNTTTAKNNSESGKSNNNNQSTTTNSNTNSQAIHTHTWQHIEATGHYETVVVQDAWDEEAPVYENVEHTICNVCGADVTGNASAHSKAHALAYEGSGWHSEWKYEQTRTQTVHHAAVTEQRWVQDSSAYDRCTTCGETK